jgi:2-iminobutanoate/2-iminopropanoate deaminase
MGKMIISTAKAPKASGPYSQAVRVGNLLFISGQLPIDPATGELVVGGIGPQTKRIMENIGAILHSQGLSFPDVVKITVYLRSMVDFEPFNRAYGEYVQSAPPARACVEVSRLPRDSGVEIEAIALIS